MMHESNALRKLEETLAEAVANGDGNEPSGPILLRAMKLSEHPQNIVDFYELLSKAGEEAKSIRNKKNIDRYIQTVEELHQVFVLSHIWNAKWVTFANHINGKNILNTLDSLADFFDRRNPKIFLDQEFLEKLNGEFSDLLSKILESNLSRDLKIFLTERVEDILKAIRRYHIDGTEGLERATKSLVSDLVMKEHILQDKDKSNPAYKHVKAWVLSFLIYIAPSPYDIIGGVPDFYEFWIPKFEELVAVMKRLRRSFVNHQIFKRLLKRLQIYSIGNRRKPSQVIESQKPFLLPSKS